MQRSRLQALLDIEFPIIQAPMAGADSPELAVAVSDAGGLGSLACALLSVDKIRDVYLSMSKRTNSSLNLNFFCHNNPKLDSTRDEKWHAALKPYYDELGLTQNDLTPSPMRLPFDETYCELLMELRPRVVSFHFGLPRSDWMERLKSVGIKILSSATTVAEAQWLERNGCDAIIAQGSEAGGHRGSFLDLNPSTQLGTFALVPQIVDAVRIPVIAAGGIADRRGVAAAMALGAEAVQIGTAYLLCPESKISGLYRKAIQSDHETALTNVFSGRPARGVVNRFMREIGPISMLTPEFPLAGAAVGPLRRKSEAQGSIDFMQLWAGQSAKLCEVLPARELTLKLAAAAMGFGDT